MTRAFPRHKDSDPLRSLALTRIPIPCCVSYKTRHADRDARCVLSPRGTGAGSCASSATKEASTAHPLSRRAEPSCGAVRDIYDREHVRARAATSRERVCTYIRLYIHVCAYVPVAAFPVQRDANGRASAAEVQRDHRRDDAAGPTTRTFSAAHDDDSALTSSREDERITPVLPTIPRGGRSTRDSNIMGAPHRRVSARERADDAVGAPAPAALVAAAPPRVVVPPREFTARYRATTATGASDDAGILAASP